MHLKYFKSALVAVLTSYASKTLAAPTNNALVEVDIELDTAKYVFAHFMVSWLLHLKSHVLLIDSQRKSSSTSKLTILLV